ncbi:hypothetical protein Tco_0747615 [Tanacetum coccineum]|uniref:Xylulose kinase-1 n=1 Tax=Tanacetum coccineum TaxID=301880 RepID=A0ABQ4YTB9_9ASTR
MVAFLKKPEGSAGFHQIVDFLNSTHIKYTLTENPTIYVSLIHQFWQTAFARTPENEEMEINATIDGRVKTITGGISMESLESDLKQPKLTYGASYTKLIMKVKKLENKVKSSKARRRARLMGAQTQGRHEYEMKSNFDFTTAEDVSTANVPVTTIGAEISTASPKVKTVGVSVVDALDDITLVETMVEIRRSVTKPQKVKGIIFKEVKKPSKKKDQIQLDEELALRLYAKEQAELERMQRERTAQEEASRAVINEELDSIQAMIKADEQLAARL